jgi:hypothetical protein
MAPTPGRIVRTFAKDKSNAHPHTHPARHASGYLLHRDCCWPLDMHAQQWNGSRHEHCNTRQGLLGGPARGFGGPLDTEGITYPHAGKAPGQPLLSTPPNIPPTVDRSVSDSPSARIAELMALAHSRTGINAWEIAELAKLRGISPWAPLRVIIAP